MKRFNDLNKVFKWVISISFGIILIFILSLWIKTVSESKIWMLLIIIIVPLIQFLITPLFTLLNFYHYYSPMVVSFGNNKRVIDLHNGTSFDYLLEMSKIKAGIKWKNKMLFFYLNALLKIISQIENGDLTNSTIIRGSSYFLSERSAKKLGFSVNKTSIIEKINIALNYFDLIWMYSLTNGKLTFPNLTKITTVRITGSELVQSKKEILGLANRLGNNASR
ncbi:MAG: hypothetical protein KJN85_12320 [Maribacter sp.]|nr:hypothetical protein [Maribacter sp.]